MQQETAGTLIGVLGGLTKAVVDAHVKIKVLHDVILEHDPELLGSYLQKVVEAERNPPFVIDLEALSRLESELVRR